LLSIILQALLILRFSKACIKIFSILLIFVFSIAIANDTREAKTIFNIIFFLTKSCFLLIIFINLLILIFATC